MKVCIAEKPSVAKEIATILKANTRKDGYFEGNGYQVTWTFGHLCTLKEPEDYNDKWKSWSLYTLPMLPERFGIKVINDSGVMKQFKTIYHLVQEAEEVINCGDAGQEGELIQRWVLNKAKCTKPLKRLWISSLTEEAIREGFEKLEEGTKYDNLFHAGSSRAIGDWLLGMNATRLYTLKYGKEKQVLSIGRVQTPTLALLVNRQLEIENFKPQTYWEIRTLYRDTYFSYTEGKFMQQEKATEVLQRIQPEELEIKDVSIKKGKELPPPLFDLTSLQVECNKKFGYSAEETLNTVQSLYEKKFVTYPRVDTTYLSDDIYPKVPGILKGIQSTYEPLVTPLLAGGPIRKSKKVFNNKKVTDHHAIIPTGVKALVTGREAEVYEVIAKRFIAVFHPDCEVSNTSILADIQGLAFKTTGKQILSPGWRVVYATDKKSTKSDEQILPAFEQGERGPHEPELQEKQTQPPKYYTEATLLRAMETAGKHVDDEELREVMKENGIGRPSTRANIIETLFRRKYIQKEKKRIYATNVGIELIGTINNDLLKSAELTGQWEHKLKQIERGEYHAGKFVAEMQHMVAGLYDEVMLDNSNQRIGYVKAKKEAKTSSEAMTCPACQKGTLISGKSAWGCSNWKNGCSFQVPFQFKNKKLTQKQIETLIKKGKSPLLKNVEFEQNKVNGYLQLNTAGELSFEEEKEEALACPKCQQNIMKGNSAWGCSNWKSGCDFKVPFEFWHKKLTDNNFKRLVQKGSTNLIKGFYKQKGDEKFNGKLRIDEGGKIGFERQD